MLEIKDLFSDELPGEGPEERRLAVRYSCQNRKCDRLVVAQGDVSCWARGRDVSSLGIGLLLAHPVAVGAGLEIQLRCHREHLRPPLCAQVVYARALLDGTWHVGCAFDNPLSGEELQPLL